MKELKEYFSGRGQVKDYVFNQISRTDYGFIYEVANDKGKHYEVFERRINTQYDCVSYPRDKSFGVWAWTCMDLESAKEKLKDIDFYMSNKENDK